MARFFLAIAINLSLLIGLWSTNMNETVRIFLTLSETYHILPRKIEQALALSSHVSLQ